MKRTSFVGALRLLDDTLVDAEAKVVQEDVVAPFPLGFHHAERMTFLPCLGYDAALMPVFDAPHSWRVVGRASLPADIFRHEPTDRAA